MRADGIPRTAWLAVGVAAGATAAAMAAGPLPTLAAGLLLLALAAAPPPGRPAAVGGMGNAATAAGVGALLVALRLVVGPPGSAVPTLDAAGSPSWTADVVSVGSPKDGSQLVRLAIRTGGEPVVVAATLPAFPLVPGGAVVEVDGRLEPPPDDDPYGEYLRRTGASGSLRATSVRVVRAPPWPSVQALRDGAGDALRLSLPEPEAGLAAGILIGLRERVDRGLAADFATAGVSHVVAISGWNIAIVATLVAAMLRGRSRRTAGLVTGGVIVAYVIAAGASPSVVRAAVMAGVVLLARGSGRAVRAPAALSLAAAGLLLLDPGLVGDAARRLARRRVGREAPRLACRGPRDHASGPGGHPARCARDVRPAVARRARSQPGRGAHRARCDGGRRARARRRVAGAARRAGTAGRRRRAAGVAAAAHDRDDSAVRGRAAVRRDRPASRPGHPRCDRRAGARGERAAGDPPPAASRPAGPRSAARGPTTCGTSRGTAVGAWATRPADPATDPPGAPRAGRLSADRRGDAPRRSGRRRTCRPDRRARRGPGRRNPRREPRRREDARRRRARPGPRPRRARRHPAALGSSRRHRGAHAPARGPRGRSRPGAGALPGGARVRVRDARGRARLAGVGQGARARPAARDPGHRGEAQAGRHLARCPLAEARDRADGACLDWHGGQQHLDRAAGHGVGAPLPPHGRRGAGRGPGAGRRRTPPPRRPQGRPPWQRHRHDRCPAGSHAPGVGAHLGWRGQ